MTLLANPFTNHRRTDDRPIRVLHVRVMAGTGGGPEKTILRSPRYIDPRKYDLRAAYLYPRNDPGFDTIREQAGEQNCPLLALPERGPVDPRPLRQLISYCRRERIDLWHGHDYKSNLFGLLVNRFHPMTLVSTAHLWTDDTRRMRLYRRVDEWCLPHYDHVVAVSTPIADRCREVGVAASKLSMIPNGMETDKWQRRFTARQAKVALGLDPDALTLGVTGRLNIQKRIDRLLAVLPRIMQQVQRPIQLLLVGDGPEQSALKIQAYQLGLTPHVRFCGWQTDTHRWYEAMDAFILPSRDEGLPNAALEAMAMHTPVAATGVGSVPELLDHGRCGIVLDQEHENWPAVLAPWLRDDAARRTMANRARARIESHYSFTLRMSRITAIYDQLLGRAATQTSPLRRAA